MAHFRFSEWRRLMDFNNSGFFPRLDFPLFSQKCLYFYVQNHLLACPKSAQLAHVPLVWRFAFCPRSSFGGKRCPLLIGPRFLRLIFPPKTRGISKTQAKLTFARVFGSLGCSTWLLFYAVLSARHFTNIILYFEVDWEFRTGFIFVTEKVILLQWRRKDCAIFLYRGSTYFSISSLFAKTLWVWNLKWSTYL